MIFEPEFVENILISKPEFVEYILISKPEFVEYIMISKPEFEKCAEVGWNWTKAWVGWINGLWIKRR